MSVELKAIADIDWSDWVPREVASLCFVMRDRQILLIRKLRGLGAGKLNGPGGRMEAGESPLDCAIREVQEELCVTPTGLQKGGEIRFQFLDGYSLLVHCFRASDCVGTPTETEEAIPLWRSLEAVPYDEMWPDDRVWLPLLIAETLFSGRFLYDGERLLDYAIDMPAGDSVV